MEQEEALGIVVGISRINNNLLANLKNNIKNYNINTTEFSLLEFLYHKGEKNIQQIRDKMLIASGSATYVVDNLVKKGYVIKRICQEDKRIYFVNITKQGIELMDELFPIHKKETLKLFSDLDTEEIITLKKLLRKIKAD